MGLCGGTLVRLRQEGAESLFAVSCSKTIFPKMFYCNKPYKACFQVFLREAQNYLWVFSSTEEDFVLFCCW